ncbi:MAG: hypothetical protein JWP03_2854 [Phycisphaerales bacterium]|nr:hypothetical protein [Phycisphaerales bacterium]
MSGTMPTIRFIAAMACVWVIFACFAPVARAQEAMPLIGPNDPGKVWTFDNGREFPGAIGELTPDPTALREGRTTLKLVGDFSKGGQYVQLGRSIDRLDIRELSMWVRNPGGDRFTLRVNDASGQTHQLDVKTEPGPDWQHIVLSFERFFARRGEADAVTNVARYESWGGAKDGRWHGPAMAIYLLVGKPGPAAGTVRTMWINDVTILPRPSQAAGKEETSIIPLDEITEGEHDWRFTRGEEFPGAKGTLTVVKDEPAHGKTCLKLAGDFTRGGAYVAGLKDLKDLNVKDVTVIRLQVKSENAASIGIQLVDGSGQTHQRKGVPITADGKWHDLTIKPAEIAGGEHWGGAQDGKWHGPPALLGISLSDSSDAKGKQPSLLLADIRADAQLPPAIRPATFKANFAAGPSLPATWTATAGVEVDAKDAFKGGRSLLLSRTLENAQQPCAVTGPAFAATAGLWQIDLACKSDLHSPDNSYSGVVELQCFDDAGKIIERFTVADVFGRHDWQAVSKRIDVPRGAASARFEAHLNKTYGTFRIDELSAAFLTPARRGDDRVARMLFSTARLGNLLFPDDARRATISIEARKPLRDDQHTISYVVRDYWGAEQMRPGTATLGPRQKKGNVFVYEAAIDLSGVPLEVGRYYELHASVPQDGGEPFTNYTSLAILPEAQTKKYKPEEIPFTSRNWDNRFDEYIRLSDRLGIRVCGIWGGWSAKPPYKPEAPNLELAHELGMGWLTNTPAAMIEQGKKDYDEQALRQGVRNLIDQYGKVRPMVINLGNEPHGTGQRVLDNVEAYRILYDEVKKVDPTITVVATSVEPNEEYFKAGYGKWCDAYDFHIYEGTDDVRRAIGEYQALARKYGQVKPIWSTELGLNSQGQTRQTVAAEVTRKFTTFFAAGGTNVSWFGLLYPDPEGKDHGSSGDSHNVFDCRYNRYCPRLDAIAYYNAVNAIAIKKFVTEKQYPQGISAFLFRDRDGRALQVLWKDRGRQDVSIPLKGVNAVTVIRIDGSRRELDAGDEGVTLSITQDPLLLLYEGGPAGLPEALGTPLCTLTPVPAAPAGARGALKLSISTGGVSIDQVGLLPPPFWTTEKSPEKSAITFTATPPAGSAVREADFTVTINGPDGHRRGALYWRTVVGE